jgi:hypothetical protein
MIPPTRALHHVQDTASTTFGHSVILETGSFYSSAPKYLSLLRRTRPQRPARVRPRRRGLDRPLGRHQRQPALAQMGSRLHVGGG